MTLIHKDRKTEKEKRFTGCELQTILWWKSIEQKEYEMLKSTK